MAIKKFTCPPQSTGGPTFSDNLVGNQLVDGGGFTLGNFEFSSGVVEKQNRSFQIGSFSSLISLESMNISNIEESKMIVAKNFQVYPYYDLSQITNFTLYGSLVTRLSASITKIINFFPAGLEISRTRPDFSTGYTVVNISYDSVENETTMEILMDAIKNPFAIDFSVNAEKNVAAYEFSTSELRNMKKNYAKYSIFISNNEYPINDIVVVNPNSTTFKIFVEGEVFPNEYFSSANFLIRPNDLEVNKVFNENFDAVENFLLNRQITPIYMAYFQVPRENEDGTYTFTYESLKFPVDGFWNLDIRTLSFENYISKLNEFATNLDNYSTNLISRFYTTSALKEFDTIDRKYDKILQIYGRSFDETRKFIGALANMNSVNYTIKNDIPSQLLKNLSETLGWQTNISPITETDFLNSVFKRSKSNFSGLAVGQTPDELNYQFYRNLIMNSAYLFKSKGTRKSIEILMKFIGAPEFLIDFNEYVYVADQRININDFETQYAKISGGTYTQEVPVLDLTDVYSIMGVQYTGVTLSSVTKDISATSVDYPLDEFGCPSMPVESDSYFFQIGGGWFESTPQHRMPEQIDITTSVFTGENPTYQTSLLPFNYGEEYLQRYRQFPYMDLGFRLRRINDNKKSWTDSNVDQRSSFDGNFNAYYQAPDECLVLNVKNVDIMLNPSLGLAYDVWSMSNTYNFPIPNEGLFYIKPTYCNPNPRPVYPSPGGIDWTVIIPKPKEKTFFEFLQTFWRNMINVRNRQFITDGKTGGYPTLSSIYWKYLESEKLIGVQNDNFNYQPIIDYLNGMGDYWVRLVEQMVPATTIWNTGVRLENSIFHRQKFVWRRQFGCQIVPIPCNPCELTTQLFDFDCPVQIVECPIYPWDADPDLLSFGTIFANTLVNYLQSSGLTTNDCILNTVTSNWYVDLKYGGVSLVSNLFATTVGYQNFPSANDWLTALTDSLNDLQTFGFDYDIDSKNDTVAIYNVNCIPVDDEDIFEINVGINFSILCNQ